MGAPRWPPNPPTFGTSRQSRDVPLSRALAWPPSRIYLHGGREMARNPPTFGTSRQSRDVPLSPRWPPKGHGLATYVENSNVSSFRARLRLPTLIPHQLPPASAPSLTPLLPDT